MTKARRPEPKPKPRRTQEERRAATIRKLLDAAADALVKVGYADASVQVICERAGVSQGALFRHFPTREALMVALGEDLARKTLESYRRAFTSLRGSEPPALLALRLLRMHTRSRLNQAWYELFVAARTRKPLRAALEPTVRSYYASIVATARETLPGIAERLGPAFPLAVNTMIAMFDGESLQRFVLEDSELDEARLQAISQLVTLLQ